MRQSGQKGFTLIEVLIVMVIMGVIFTMTIQMVQTWSKATAHAAMKKRQDVVEQDLRRLYEAVRDKRNTETGYPSAGPWPEQIPQPGPLPWRRPAPGFEELSWAPSESPTYLQFRVDGWATSFVVSAIGDLNKDGALELYRIWGDVGMYERGLPYPPAEVTPVNP